VVVRVAGGDHLLVLLLDRVGFDLYPEACATFVVHVDVVGEDVAEAAL